MEGVREILQYVRFKLDKLLESLRLKCDMRGTSASQYCWEINTIPNIFPLLI